MGKVCNKVLVIEDDPDVMDIICDFLELSGYTPLACHDSRKAENYLTQHEPPVVITDIVMPDREGMNVIMDIKRNHNDVKIIAISGSRKFAQLDILKSARGLGADSTLEKPFSAEQLKYEIEYLMHCA